VTSVQTDIRELQQYLDGQWVGAADGASFDDLDPFTGDVGARIPAG
jgi:hypothetical protein